MNPFVVPCCNTSLSKVPKDVYVLFFLHYVYYIYKVVFRTAMYKLANQIKNGVHYSKKQVNDILKHYHPDQTHTDVS
ncbi:hypothetical protein KDK_16950 [Dictyobacter kobayashii]|uniref:DUF2087 domain-containing protein n=1 Tax=Dictyobacter kobayashii TaxID=2014872 RepID=A0A402AFN8_9CHLR|nr:hypothetical protein KDK_16950 [Dictyobacter kobayashii]